MGQTLKEKKGLLRAWILRDHGPGVRKRGEGERGRGGEGERGRGEERDDRVRGTVEPPNKGHFGANSFVPCREVVCISEVK